MGATKQFKVRQRHSQKTHAGRPFILITRAPKMTSDNAPLPELDKLIHEIRSGQRASSFPPGTFTTVWIIMVTLLCTILTTVLTMRAFLQEYPGSVQGIFYLVSSASIIPGCFLPIFMISRGKKQFANWHRCFLFYISALATLDIIVIYLYDDLNLTVSILATIISWNTLTLMRGPNYLLFCEYCYRINRP